MSAVDQRTVGAKVNNKTADMFFAMARADGRTPSKILAEYIDECVYGKRDDITDIGIDLVEAFIDNGYPEYEIRRTIERIKSQITPYTKADWA